MIECAREQDVIAAVASRRWPERCDASLRAHVASCEVCRDVAEVALAFDADSDLTWQEVRVPTAAHVWWRLQMRARQEAERAVIRPIAVVQGAAALAVAAVAAAAIAFGWVAGSWSLSDAGHIVDLVGKAPPLARTAIDAVLAVAGGTPQTALVLGALVAGLVIMPVAVYLALSE